MCSFLEYVWDELFSTFMTVPEFQWTLMFWYYKSKFRMVYRKERGFQFRRICKFRMVSRKEEYSTIVTPMIVGSGRRSSTASAARRETRRPKPRQWMPGWAFLRPDSAHWEDAQKRAGRCRRDSSHEALVSIRLAPAAGADGFGRRGPACSRQQHDEGFCSAHLRVRNEEKQTQPRPIVRSEALFPIKMGQPAEG